MNREAKEVREVSPGYDLMAAKPAANEGYVALGDITRWLSGGTPSRAVESYWKGQIPWISASTLKKVEVAESDQCVTVEAVASGSKMAPIDSTLLLVRGSALHNEIRAGIVRNPVCFNQDVKALIPNESAYPVYLTYSILGNEKELLKLVSSAGNTAGVLDTKLVQSFRIWLPALNEQRAIATALSDVDALLEELDRLIAKKRDIKQAAMQQLLTGKARLPGFEREWETKRLGEIAPLQRGFDLPTSRLKSGNYPVVYSNGIWGYHSRAMVKGPGVVTGRSGTLGRIHYLEEDYWPHNTTLWVTNFHNNNPKFIAYLYEKVGFERFASGSGVPTLNRNDAHGYKIAIPPSNEEQAAIADILSDIDAEHEALERRLTKTAALKQAMMKELLTGRTRLMQK